MEVPMRRWMLLFAFLLFLTPAPAQKKEVAELQRDVAYLQEQVRTLQRAFDEKMGQVTTLAQQSLDAQKDVTKALTVMETRFNDRLNEQAKNVGAPIATLGTKVDQMGSEFQSVSVGMTDLLSRMNKLEQKLVDLNNAMLTLQAPPPAPGAGGPAGTPPGGTASAIPPVPAEKLYEDAYRDKISGKPELALKGFRDYLAYYGDTENAPKAQLWIGKIYFEQGDYKNAVDNFEAVITKYGDNLSIPEAMLGKGQALLQTDQRTAAADEFRRLALKYPKSSVATQACDELKKLTFACPQPARARRSTKSSK
jgi:TolA-binding protein